MHFYIQKKIIEFKFQGGNAIGIAVLSFVALGAVGCARTQKTTTTQTTVTYPNQNQGMIYQGTQSTTTRVKKSDDPQNAGVVEKSETATTTTQTKDKEPGILSSTLHAVGYVISLPFIIIGGLFRIIFGG